MDSDDNDDEDVHDIDGVNLNGDDSDIEVEDDNDDGVTMAMTMNSLFALFILLIFWLSSSILRLLVLALMSTILAWSSLSVVITACQNYCLALPN